MGQKGREDVENKDGWMDGRTADGRNKEKRKKKKTKWRKEKKKSKKTTTQDAQSHTQKMHAKSNTKNLGGDGRALDCEDRRLDLSPSTPQHFPPPLHPMSFLEWSLGAQGGPYFSTPPPPPAFWAHSLEGGRRGMQKSRTQTKMGP